MEKKTIEVSRSIAAPGEVIYSLLADYRSGHPRILPRRYFSGISVREGGIGEGTRVRFEMKAFGTTRSFDVVVLEPDPGHLLIETDLEAGIVTSFQLESIGYGGTIVTISTRMPVAEGPFGWLQWLATRRYLERVYTAELRLLARAVCVSVREPGTREQLPAPSWSDDTTRTRLIEAS